MPQKLELTLDEIGEELVDAARVVQINRHRSNGHKKYEDFYRLMFFISGPIEREQEQ